MQIPISRVITKRTEKVYFQLSREEVSSLDVSLLFASIFLNNVLYVYMATSSI